MYKITNTSNLVNLQFCFLCVSFIFKGFGEGGWVVHVECITKIWRAFVCSPNVTVKQAKILEFFL